MMGARLSIDFTMEGYTVALALDGESGAELLGKVPVVIEKLQEMGAAPTAALVAGNGNGTAAQPESKVCPLHHTPMRRRTGKGGDVWYSHKAVDPDSGAEYWCRGQERGNGR